MAYLLRYVSWAIATMLILLFSSWMSNEAVLKSLVLTSDYYQLMNVTAIGLCYS